MLDSDGKLKGGAFAPFEVNCLATMQLSEVHRHCHSGQHKQALRQLEEQGCDPPGLVAPEVIGVQVSLVDQAGAVPRADRFVWGIQTCQRGASFRYFPIGAE